MCQSSYHLQSLGYYRERIREELDEEIGGRGTKIAPVGLTNSNRVEPRASGERIEAHDLSASRERIEAGEPSEACKQPDLPERFESRERLEGEIAATAAALPDVHVASSLLQKALRRGDRVYAHGAAAMLLVHDEPRLWRRLSVCAFEDFGLADLDLTARVVAAAASRNFRLAVGQRRVLTHLVDALCSVPKDRRLDDAYALGLAVLRDPGVLGSLAGGPDVLVPFVQEVSRLIGRCERAVPGRRFRSLDAGACERTLCAMAEEGLADQGLFELCLQGRKCSATLLPLILPLAIAATDAAGGRGQAVVRVLPETPLISGVPAYALDGFTRRGRAVLAALPRHVPEIAGLLETVSSKERFDALHHLLFYAEGGRCAPELDDALLVSLRAHALAIGARRPLGEAQDACRALEALLPVIHTLRGAAPRNEEIKP